MASKLDDTWTISDLSSSHGGSLRNSLTSSTDVNNVNKRQKIQKPIYSPISSIGSQSDSDEFQKPIKPFLKRTSGGYKAVENVKMEQNGLPSDISSNLQFKDNKPPTNIIPLPSHPKVKISQEKESIKSTESVVPLSGPDLFSLAKSGVHNLAVSQNLRGYEIAPPKVTTHMDFLEYMKFHTRKREYEMVMDSPKTKKVEDKKEMKIPEALYTYFAKPSPQKKEDHPTEQRKEPQTTPKFPKQIIQNAENRSLTPSTRKISARKFDIEPLKKKETPNPLLDSQSKNPDKEELERLFKENKPKEKNIEKISSIESAVKESEQKLSSFQKTLERIVEEKEKEYDNILSKTTNQISSTINNSMSKMGLDLKNFYKQFDKLQKVTSDISSKFGRQLSDEQRKSQTLISKQMKQIEDMSKKIETIEKKTTQVRDATRKITVKTVSKVRGNKKTKDFFQYPTNELTIDEIHTEVSKKHPSIFKYPNVSFLINFLDQTSLQWDETSPLSNLEFYQNEQKCLIDELIGKSIEFPKNFTPILECDQTIIENPIFSIISYDKKVKIDAIPSKPLVISKTELSSDEIKKQFPEFSKSLLKYSVSHNENLPCLRDVTPPLQADEKPEETLSIVKMEAHFVQTEATKDISVHEVEIQTDIPLLIETDNSNIGAKDIVDIEVIEKCNIDWREKDNSAMHFQKDIDTTVEKEISKYEKERIIREILPKKNVNIPKLNDCEEFDGICFTSHYVSRSIKTDENIQKHMVHFVEEKKSLDLIFEEYANCLIERVVKYISTNIIGEYLNNIFFQKENGIYCCPPQDEKFNTIKGGALCAEFFSFCFENELSFDDEVIFKVTEELVTEFIKSKQPYEEQESVTELCVDSNSEYDLEKVSELVLRLLLLNRLSGWNKEKEECKEREFISHKFYIPKGQEVSLKERVVTNLPNESPEKHLSFGTIETQTEEEKEGYCASAPQNIDSVPRLGLPHSTFFILSDLPDSTVPISVSTEPIFQQHTAQTQTINEGPRLESSSVQTSNHSKSISAVQTESPTTRSTTTETNAKSLFLQYNPSSFYNVTPQVELPKETTSRDIQTSFSLQPLKPKRVTHTCLSPTTTETSFSSETENNNTPSKPLYMEPVMLQKDKVFATLTENDIEKMLKIQMLKRSIGKEFKNMESFSSDSESEESFLSSEQSMSTFSTSDSSNGFSYSQKRYNEKDDCFNSSSSFSENYRDASRFSVFTSSLSDSGLYSHENESWN